jgi:hypothetical protein
MVLSGMPLQQVLIYQMAGAATKLSTFSHAATTNTFDLEYNIT